MRYVLTEGPMMLRRALALLILAVSLVATGSPADAARRGGPRTPLEIGVNLSSYAGGGSTHALPPTQAVDYFYSKGFRVFRIPFNPTRMLSAPGGPLNATYLNQYKSLVSYVLTKEGATVEIDPHDARYSIGATYDDYNGPTGGTQVIPGEDARFTAAQYADFWVRLATAMPDPRLRYELINEPHDQDTGKLLVTMNTTIAALRTAGFGNYLIVPFNGYSNRFSLINDFLAQTTMLNSIVDPLNYWGIQYHLYMDAGSAGADTSIQIGFMSDIATGTAWARANGKRFEVTEIGAGTDAASLAGLDTVLAYMNSNRDVFPGFAYWAAPLYQDENYPPLYRYQLLPIELGGGGVPGPYTDRPQMGVISRYLQ